MNHAPVSYRSHHSLHVGNGFGSHVAMYCENVGIHSYGVLLSYMWYTKWLLFCPYLCSGLAEMLCFSNPPSTPLWLDLSSDIGSLPVKGLPAEPLPRSETSVVARDISSVGAVN
jgi:hypothetical protein